MLPNLPYRSASPLLPARVKVTLVAPAGTSSA
jgi:hypothetical protein